MNTKSVGIVLELQRDCLDSSTKVSVLLRKAKAIAAKLDLQELSDWFDSELNGYRGLMVDLPKHRHASGSAKFWNPYNGWCPIIAQDENLSAVLSKAYFPQPIAQLEEWVQDSKGTLTYKFPHAIQQHLMRDSDFQFEAVMHISTSQIVSAIDFVRNKVLDWTLELEKKDIVGNGFRITVPVY
jgi:AbiTii